MADGRHLENRYDVIIYPRMIRFRCADGESHADDSENVKIETDSKI